jgi:DNA-binding CsgD family transcriptional regulator
LQRDICAVLDRVAEIAERPVPFPGRPRALQMEPVKSLTIRQKEILHWVAMGKSNTAIACILGISAHTVDTHLRRIFLRLGTTDRTVTAIKAVQEGLIPAAA